MPGYGQSEGARDFAGPATIAALSAALDTLARTPGVDSTRIAVWGISHGGAAALNLAAQRPDLRAAIVQSAIVDLWATHRAARAAKDAALAADIEKGAGRDSASWRQRSPAVAAMGLKIPVLIAHAEDDARAPIAGVRAFAADLAARGVTVETKFVPTGGHPVGPHVPMQTAVAFLRRVLAP
jgi:dipeptidyl aminopeptidase/acylaminoacyl peptidase